MSATKRSGMARVLRALAVVCVIGAGLGAWADDWAVFRHDLFGTGASPESLSTSQAAQLAVKWSNPSAVPIGNPILVNGSAYITTVTGRLMALDSATGAIRWQHNNAISGPFTCAGQTMKQNWQGPVGAPAVVGSHVYFPGADGAVYSYDAATGAQEWKTVIANPVSGNEFLWSSAFPLNGKLYIGVGTAFEPYCGEAAGRLVVLDQASGTVLGTWWVDANHGSGGGLWLHPAYDPATRRLFVTTGTIAKGLTGPQQPLSQAIVAIDPDTLQTLDWYQATATNFYADLDFGTGPTLYDLPDGTRMAVATNKNGNVYGYRRDNLKAGPVWSYTISGPGASPDLGESSIAPPAYANGLVFVGGGKTVDGYPGAIAALDGATGVARWMIHPDGFVLPGLTAVGNVVAVGLSALNPNRGALLVLDQQTGAVVYRKNTADRVFAEPTFANGVFYFGDLTAALYALQAPAVVTTSTSSSSTTGSTTGSGSTTGTSTSGSSGINLRVTASPGFSGASAPYFVELDATTTTTTDPSNWIAAFSWQLSDGASGNAGWIDHTFAANGVYTATVTATDGHGLTAQKTVTITVGPQSTTSATSTSGGSGGPGTTATSTTGSTATSTTGSTASSSTGTTGGSTTGSSGINLRVTASPGFSGTSAPYFVELDATTTTTTDPSNWIASFSWQLSDGASGNAGWIDHTFAANGVYTATVTATDGHGQTASKTVTINVGPQSTTSTSTTTGTTATSTTTGTTGSGQQPVAVITGGPFTGAAPLSVYVDGTTSYTRSSSGWISAFKWDFGDGTASTAGYQSHHFNAPGSYTVTLTAIAGDGTRSTAVKQVTVTP
jgi:outer membrane protein assembly factor BamB